MEVHLYAWIITVVVMVTILVIDVLIIGRRPHEPSMKEAGLFIGIYVTLAVLFGFGVWAIAGARYAGEFFAGWITEYSLSIDNLFIFLVILTKLKVPRQLQQFAAGRHHPGTHLSRHLHCVGGCGHQPVQLDLLHLRGVPDLDRREALSRLPQAREETDEPPDNVVLRFVRRRFNATEDYRGTKLTVVENGKRLITPMLIVIIALGSTDLLLRWTQSRRSTASPRSRTWCSPPTCSL